MTSDFTPPSSETLSSVDIADCEYRSDLVEVEGVTSQQGQGGWQRTVDYSVHSLAFSAWRIIGQRLCRNNLTLLRPVPVDAKYFDDFPKGTIHKLEVLLSVDGSRAIVSRHLEENMDDAELAAVAREEEQPVIVKTQRFGDLTLNRRINWFDGVTDWNGRQVKISLEADEGLDPSNQLKTAEALFSDSTQWQVKLEAFAVAETLELANDWQEEGDEIDASEFLRRMKLESISIARNGGFSFWHDDDDIFLGHAIEVSGSLDEGLTSSDLAG